LNVKTESGVYVYAKVMMSCCELNQTNAAGLIKGCSLKCALVRADQRLFSEMCIGPGNRV